MPTLILAKSAEKEDLDYAAEETIDDTNAGNHTFPIVNGDEHIIIS